METHDTSLLIEATNPGRDSIAAAGQARATETENRPVAPAFPWQALLLRYLPDPVGPSHNVKRLALR